MKARIVFVSMFLLIFCATLIGARLLNSVPTAQASRDPGSDRDPSSDLPTSAQVFPRAYPYPVPNTAMINMSTSPLVPGWIFASFEEPFVPRYSSDGGRTWHPVQTAPWTSNPYWDQLVSLLPKEDGSFTPRLLVAVNSESVNMKNGVWRSGDLGASWAHYTWDRCIAAPIKGTPGRHGARLQGSTWVSIMLITWKQLTKYFSYKVPASFIPVIVR
jgi:hypothetical protein